MKRAILVVLDSVGIGELPDAARYGDEGSNTLCNLKQAYPAMELPHMQALGLGNIPGAAVLGPVAHPTGGYGKMAEKSNGKDTTTGHWELAGIITENPFPTFTETGFPKEFIEQFEQAIGTKVLGNYAASGTVIIQDLGDEHRRTGYPIVYTSADSVFQIAAHEDVIPLERLYEICQIARDLLTGDWAVGRVIARPFIGNQKGEYTRTKNRKDFSLPPTGPTILDAVKAAGMTVAGVGKIEDIFEHRGLTRSTHTPDNQSGIRQTIAYTQEAFGGLIFTNLVDTDMIYGHRNDVPGYANALMAFDAALPELMAAMKPDDILIISADHGCDPTTPSTDHSREYVPLLVWGPGLSPAALGVRATFADVAATIADYLDLPDRFPGQSFLKEVRP